ncbi:hypothetical protein HN766_06335 [Candidatus Poribacteria bacterium]|nr:hypothetical protein [Candidatus Poribacteria bacterium]
MYSGGVYRPDADEELSFVEQAAHYLYAGKSSAANVRRVLDWLTLDTSVARDAIEPLGQEWVNSKSGWVSWRSGETIPHSPDVHSTVQIPYAYDPDADCPEIHTFLANVLPQDAVTFVQEMLGLLLIPEMKYQRFFVFKGDGSNGKSVLLDVIRTFLGDAACGQASLQSLTSNRFAASTLVGKRANICGDLSSLAIRNPSILKQLTGGDFMWCEQKYRDPGGFQPKVHLLFSANELPRSSETNEGYYRRWTIIPFPNRFEGSDIDHDLRAKLTTPQEMSGLLNVAMEGLRRLDQRGDFDIPRSVEAELDAYRERNEPTRRFLLERFAPDANGHVRTVHAEEMHKAWCAHEGEQCIGRNGFHKQVEAVFPSAYKAKVKNRWSFRGLSLRDA